jgi:hypothetical protein
VNGAPSIFVQAVIDYPLGGPAFFFIEGLVFGFGYNRSLKLPPVEQVSTFPLVALAREAAAGGSPGDLAARLGDHVVPAEGEYFVTAGVKFTSFKLVEGVVLLAVAFGQQLEIDVLGIATLSSPPRATAGSGPLLMRAELGLVARYQPAAGLLSIEGRLLPDAYLFAEACHLTGGFAFRSWSATGDFVLTMGGYHTKFKPPAHYPRVPRLGLSWKVDECLSLKADAYFAVTPAAFMAGGHLRANWESGDLHAWFNGGIDCLVAWQPYHYDAHAELAIGASYRTWCHTFTVELSAALHVWGPPFSGTAHVKWWVFSFDIAFGDARKPPRARPAKLPTTWHDVQQGFLPAPADVLSVTAEAGQTAQHGQTTAGSRTNNKRDDLGAINPRELRIRLHSAIPIKSGTALGQPLADPRTDVGIAPMGKSDADWTAAIDVEVLQQGSPVRGRFTCKPCPTTQLPAALWGHDRAPRLGAPTLVEALTDLLIEPLAIVPESPLPPIPTRASESLDLSTPARSPAVTGEPLTADEVVARVRSSVQRPDTRQARATVLRGLVAQPGCDWSGRTVESWREAPRVVRVQG